MTRSIDEVQLVQLAGDGFDRERDALRFDGDASLPLQIHRVEHLGLHLPRLETAAFLDESIRQSRFAVINMSNDGKVADILHLGRGACLSNPRGRDRGGFGLRRGGADEVGWDPIRRRQRRLRPNPPGPEGLVLQSASAALRGLPIVTAMGQRRAPSIRCFAGPTRLTWITQTGSWGKPSIIPVGDGIRAPYALRRGPNARGKPIHRRTA